MDSSTVRFSWQDNSDNETGFKLYATSLMTATTATTTVPGANTSTCTVAGLDTYGYWFHVCAYNAAGESEASGAIIVNVGAPIAAPTNLRTTSVGSTTVSLAWDQNSTDLYYFSLERSATSDSAGFAETATSGSSSCTDTSCSSSATYWFRVRQVGGTGVTSGYSNVVKAATIASVQPPTGLTAGPGASSIALSWTASPTQGVSYAVSRRQSGYSYASTLASSIAATSYTDTSVTLGVMYFYTVKAVLGAESSASTPECGRSLVYQYGEVENNGPASWASNQDWYFAGDNLTGLDYFEITGGYSGSYAIYNPSVYKNYDYDVFKISIAKGNSITFTKNSGNTGSGGMSLGLFWLDSTGQFMGHYFASGGETYTLVMNAGVSVSHAYIGVNIPSTTSALSYDFSFTISR